MATALSLLMTRTPASCATAMPAKWSAPSCLATETAAIRTKHPGNAVRSVNVSWSKTAPVVKLRFQLTGMKSSYTVTRFFFWVVLENKHFTRYHIINNSIKNNNKYKII